MGLVEFMLFGLHILKSNFNLFKNFLILNSK